jgi:RHS repeat-associated protein
VYLDGVPLAQLVPIHDRFEGTEIYYYHVDQLGTPQKLTDQDQAVVWDTLYEPFGKVSLLTAQIDNPLRFPGQYYDQETGLHHNYFRDYDLSLGRYVQSDPIGLGGGLNTYAYANANPLRFVDKRGLATTVVTVRTLGFGVHSSVHVDNGGDGQPGSIFTAEDRCGCLVNGEATLSIVSLATFESTSASLPASPFVAPITTVPCDD